MIAVENGLHPEEMNDHLGAEERKRLFNKFSGSIHREINEKAELLQALDGKYDSVRLQNLQKNKN